MNDIKHDEMVKTPVKSGATIASEINAEDAHLMTNTILNDIVPHEIITTLCGGRFKIEASLKDEFCPEEIYKNKWTKAYPKPTETDFKLFNFRLTANG